MFWNLLLGRPALDIAEFWQEDKIKDASWMFTGASEINDDMKKMVEIRQDMLTTKMGPINALLAAKPGCKNHERLFNFLTKFESIRKELED